jgi:hypothetical protein
MFTKVLAGLAFAAVGYVAACAVAYRARVHISATAE